MVQGKARWAAGGARLTSIPIKNTLLYGFSFIEWIPYLVCRITQQYFKKCPSCTMSTIFIYAIEISRTFIFNILFLLDTFSPTICNLFHAIRKKGFWFIMKWVMHCFLQLIICKSTSYSILDRSNRWKSEGANSGLWGGCSRTSQFSCWRWGVACHIPENAMTTLISVLCE